MYTRVDQVNHMLCPDGVNKSSLFGTTIVAGDIHWEGPAWSCDHCPATLERAYGDPDEEEEEHMTTYHLWLLECKDGYSTRLHTFYAFNEGDAESQVDEFLQEHPYLERVSLKLYPEGFRFLWHIRPGTIERPAWNEKEV